MIQPMPRPARIGQLARFAASGATVAGLYVGTTTVLIAAGIHAQIALAAGYVAGLALHFTLNRQFVFTPGGGFAHRLSTQAVRYLLVAGVAYLITAVALATLPRALGAPEIAVFITVTAAVTVVNFLALRSWVFPRHGTTR